MNKQFGLSGVSVSVCCLFPFIWIPFLLLEIHFQTNKCSAEEPRKRFEVAYFSKKPGAESACNRRYSSRARVQSVVPPPEANSSASQGFLVWTAFFMWKIPKFKHFACFFSISLASTLCLRHFATFEAKLHCRREVSNLNCTPMRLEWTKRTKHANLNFEVLANRACLINASGPLDLKPETLSTWENGKQNSRAEHLWRFWDSGPVCDFAGFCVRQP